MDCFSGCIRRVGKGDVSNNWNTHLHEYTRHIHWPTTYPVRSLHVRGVIDYYTVIVAVCEDDIMLTLTCEDVTAHVTSLYLAQFRIRTWGHINARSHAIANASGTLVYFVIPAAKG